MWLSFVPTDFPKKGRQVKQIFLKSFVCVVGVIPPLPARFPSSLAASCMEPSTRLAVGFDKDNKGQSLYFLGCYADPLTKGRRAVKRN